VRLVRLGAVGAATSQAVYHALARRMTPQSQDTVVLCSPAQPYLCLGYHQTYGQVIHRAEAARRGLPVIRRRVGGGLTYLDSQQLFYQFVFHHSRLPPVPKRLYARLLAAPVAALNQLGCPATLEGMNEIEVNHRRIAGIGGGRVEEASVVVGNILLDFPADIMAALWPCPFPAFARLAAQALDKRVTTLRKEGLQASMEKVEATLAASLAPALGRPVAPGELTPEEWETVREEEQALTDPEFLELHGEGETPPLTELKISARAYIHARQIPAPGKDLWAALLVKEGVIEQIEWEPLEEKKKGEKADLAALTQAWLGRPLVAWKKEG